MSISTENQQTVAIIMPVYNAQNTINRAIESVLKQTCSDWKLYIINDCSNDNTRDIIQPYLTDERIKLIDNNQNQGVAASRNIGVTTSQEQIISFLDSDDEWLSDKLTLQLQALSSEQRIIASSYYYQFGNKILRLVPKNQFLSKVQYLRKQFRVCFSSVLIKRDDNSNFLFEKMGHEDFLYLANWLGVYGEMVILKQPLTINHQTTGSLSANKAKACYWHYQVLKKIFKNKPMQLTYYMFFYIWNALIILFKKKFSS